MCVESNAMLFSILGGFERLRLFQHTVGKYNRVTSPTLISKSSKYSVIDSCNSHSGPQSIALLMKDTVAPAISSRFVARLPRVALETGPSEPAL